MGAWGSIIKLEIIYGLCIGVFGHHSSIVKRDTRILLLCVLDYQPSGMQHECIWYEYIWILWASVHQLNVVSYGYEKHNLLILFCSFTSDPTSYGCGGLCLQSRGYIPIMRWGVPTITLVSWNSWISV